VTSVGHFGPIVDPSHLQGLLERIAGLGLTLRSFNPIETENVEPASQTPTQPTEANHDDPGTYSRGP
jgi:hypothetical protein